MSCHRPYEDARCDSANDVTYRHSTTTQDDFEDSSTMAASSVYDPWSEFNTRLEPDYPSPFAQREWQPQPYPVSGPSRFDYANQTLTNALSPFEPFPRYDSPGADSLRSCSSSPSPTPLRPWAAASSASATTAPEDNNGSNKNLSCGVCGQWFTGRYCRSNLGRHGRLKHGQQKRAPYQCLAVGCFSVFERSDARLKHARSQHPELNLPPVQRRHGTELDVVNPYVSTDVDVSQDPAYSVGQWLSTEQEPIGHHMSVVQHEVDSSAGVEQLPLAARCVFGTLQMKLEPHVYARIRDSFFARWDSIVQRLKDDHSDAYSVYAMVVDDIRAVINAIDVAAHDPCAAAPVGYYSRASQRTVPYDNSKPSVGHNTGKASQNDRISKPIGARKHPHTSALGNHVQVVLDEHVNKEEDRKVDCPVYKYCSIYNFTSPCTGCSKPNMSQLRGHFRNAGRHDGYPPCIHQCSRCQQDFIDEQLYDDHTRTRCVAHPQIRGDIVLSWGRFYLTLYPHERHIPVPWTNATGWLSDSEVRRCRAPLAASAASSPFLEARPSPHRSRPQTPAYIAPPDEQAYGGAMNLVLNDVINPRFLQLPNMTEPVLNQDQEDLPSLQPPPVDTLISRAQYFHNVMQTFIAYQGAIAAAAPHLDSAQLAWMASQLTYMSRITRGAHDHVSSHPPQMEIHPATAHESPSTLAGGSMYATPSRSTNWNGNYVTPAASTQPSSYGNTPNSSQYIGSAGTHPSSTSDSRLLSPNSQLNRRQSGSVLSSPSMQDSVGLRRGLPSRISLPDEEHDNDRPHTHRPPLGRR